MKFKYIDMNVGDSREYEWDMIYNFLRYFKLVFSLGTIYNIELWLSILC